MEAKESGISEEFKGLVYAIKKQLNVSRDQWAAEVVDALIKEAATSGGSQISDWHKGQWDIRTIPPKLAIVIDEATDVDFAAAVIANVRTLSAKYLKRLAQKDVLFILAGTGLDAIQDGRAGTNPAYSRLVVTTRPSISALESKGVVTPAVAEALKHGTFSRILKDNARMLFRSVLPLLKLS